MMPVDAALAMSLGRVLRDPHRRADDMGMPASIYYSAEMVRALPEDGKRYESAHGELLVTPAPSAAHQFACKQLVVLLDQYLRLHPVGEVLASPADISWAPDVLVQPDVFVVRADEARTFDWTAMRHLLLAIEVLSPSTGRADRFTKRRVYQEYGVPCYWVVDIEGRAVEVWTPAAAFPVVERERVIWRPEASGEPLEIAVADILPPA
jgi:Uma2 family endonuclease